MIWMWELILFGVPNIVYLSHFFFLFKLFFFTLLRSILKKLATADWNPSRFLLKEQRCWSEVNLHWDFCFFHPCFFYSFVLPWYQYSIFQTISPIFYFSADFHLYIQHTTFLSQLSVFGPLSPSSSPLQFHGPFFSIFFLHKGRELLYKPVVFPHHLLTTVQNALWCSSHKCRSSCINYAAADTLLHWVLITCIQSVLFDFPSHLHVLQTTLYFHLCIICSGCHYHIRTRLRKWSAISTSTTLWSYNPYTHINTFCLSTPTHSLWPIPAGLRSE